MKSGAAAVAGVAQGKHEDTRRGEVSCVEMKSVSAAKVEPAALGPRFTFLVSLASVPVTSRPFTSRPPEKYGLICSPILTLKKAESETRWGTRAQDTTTKRQGGV